MTTPDAALLPLVYRLAWYLLTPLLLGRLYWRGRQSPGYRLHWRERFGYYRQPARAAGNPLIWLHAVSLGEMRAASPLIIDLHRQRPTLHWLITTTTPTGRAAAEAIVAKGIPATIVYAPYDTGAVTRLIEWFRPNLALLVENEVWPNWQRACRRAQVPVLLVSARMSATSFDRYWRLPWVWFGLLQPAWANLAWVAAQTDADAERISRLGASTVTVMGNLKYDLTPEPALLAMGETWRQQWGLTACERVVFAASSRNGEEAIILAAWAHYQQLRRDQTHLPRLRLIIAPRHPERFTEVADLIVKAGLTLCRRSQRPPDPLIDVWLGDSLGEMPAYYHAADLTIMGGTLGDFGGQNLIEAIACGCPPLLGPSRYHFSQAAADAIAAGAAVDLCATPSRVAYPDNPPLTASPQAGNDDLALVIAHWLAALDENAVLALKNAAAPMLHRHLGASRRMGQCVLSWLEGQGSSK